MSDVALRRGAASEVAERAIAARRSRGLLGWPASPRIVAVFALVAILLASAAFLLALAGQKPVHPLSATGRLAYITADRSFNGAVAHITVPDGTGPDIATVDTGFVLWSPSGRFLVVEGGARDEPDHASYLVLDPDGRQVGHITAGQNASVSWAPVSGRLRRRQPDADRTWLRIYGPTGDVQRDLTVPAGVTKLLDPALSPDERRVLVNGCSTCLLSAHDGKSRLHRQPGPLGDRCRWTRPPDPAHGRCE